MVIGFLLIMFFPLVYSIYMSLTDWQLLGDPNFIGTENYQRLVNDSNFWVVLKNTLIFAAGLVPINILIALLLALLLQRNLPGIGLFRTAIFIPVMTSIVVWSIIWKYMFGTEEGFINQVLAAIGIDGPAWLYDPDLAMGAVIVVSALKNVGLNMVLFLAALQQVDKNLYEASYLDGANKAKQFWHVTLPMITPTVFLTLILTVIGSMKVFGQIYVMTNGGPGNHTKVLVYYIWENAFKLFDFGYASAIALVLFVIILFFTIIQWSARKRWVFHEE
ncbi:sugar ABC transporter permease [Bacillus sp. EB106-08-02-XG196]|uniref:carbohydrate ABC transporter permease n=1 Tax=Bacillus sp. EB106-08-02-XG196 TaxID=2737049 RepID=UPI0015C4375D|nr:sugar ABC transporter permease [Bacillus sp. EB106-08-02-XG196]NWQ42757.1 sugar ABC transporter permease [Bacillus sp. EB106-08-02-XG196]